VEIIAILALIVSTIYTLSYIVFEALKR